MLDQLKRMAVLAAVVRHGSLPPPPPAAHQHLGRQPAGAGVGTRHGRDPAAPRRRKLSLTRRGAIPRRLRRHVGRRAGQQELAQLRDAPEGELRVAMTVGFARIAGPALAPRCAATRPAAALQVEDGLTDLVAHRVDLALRFGRLPDSAWVAQRIGQLRVGVYTAPS